jgi:hypothetical protein
MDASQAVQLLVNAFRGNVEETEHDYTFSVRPLSSGHTVSVEPVSKPFHNNFQLARHLHEC